MNGMNDVGWQLSDGGFCCCLEFFDAREASSR